MPKVKKTDRLCSECLHSSTEHRPACMEVIRPEFTTIMRLCQCPEFTI